MNNAALKNLESVDVSMPAPVAYLPTRDRTHLSQAAALLVGTDYCVDKRNGLIDWIRGPVNKLLPHEAMICAHSIEHSLGYEVTQLASFGISRPYLDSILTSRKNIYNKIFSTLMCSEGMLYLDAPNLMRNGDDGAELLRAGYTNMVGYTYRSNGERRRLTNIVFFQIDRHEHQHYAELEPVLMPLLHGILENMKGDVSDIESCTPSHVLQHITLTPREQEVAEFVVQGSSNKEIAKFLDMNERTVKKYVCNLMLKFNVKNRTALAIELYKRNQLSENWDALR